MLKVTQLSEKMAEEIRENQQGIPLMTSEVHLSIPLYSPHSYNQNSSIMELAESSKELEHLNKPHISIRAAFASSSHCRLTNCRAERNFILKQPEFRWIVRSRTFTYELTDEKPLNVIWNMTNQKLVRETLRICFEHFIGFPLVLFKPVFHEPRGICEILNESQQKNTLKLRRCAFKCCC